MGPKVLPTYFQERAGVLRVAALLNATGLIFRETPNADVGLDGYVEMVDENGLATGSTIAVQIKSGKSYLNDAGDAWKFYPPDKHRHYWEMYPLPVVLMIHDPDSDEVFWADVRYQLRSQAGLKGPMLVPKASTLTTAGSGLFATCGSSGAGLLPEKEVLYRLVTTKSENASFPLSYIDIFLDGLTDIGRKLFFSVGMCIDLAELKLPEDSPSGVGMGGGEQAFLDGYLRLLVEQSLAHVDYSDALIDIESRGLYPTILVPLSSRGLRVRDLCRELGACGSRYEITEALIGPSTYPGSIERALANIEVGRKLSQVMG